MVIRTLETLIYDCPNTTSNGHPKTTPLDKMVSKFGGYSRSLGQEPSLPLPTPVVAPLGIIMSYERFNWSNLDKHD